MRSDPHDDMLYGSSSSGATSYDTATSQVDERSSMIGQPPSRRSSVSTIRTAATTATTTETTSDSLHDSVVLHESMLESGYLSPIDPNSVASEFMNERRYRMLLQHEYHTTRALRATLSSFSSNPLYSHATSVDAGSSSPRRRRLHLEARRKLCYTLQQYGQAGAGWFTGRVSQLLWLWPCCDQLNASREAQCG